jgi:hypothetical protein
MRRARSLLLMVAVVAALGVPAAPAQAQPAKGGDFGLGVILGDPSGFTGKVFFSPTQALDFHIGIAGFYRHGELGVYADYLFHFDTGLRSSVLALPIYFGPGLGLVFDYDDGYRYCTKFRCYDWRDNGVWFALRVPVGVALWFKKFAGEVFLEVIPTLYLIRHADFDLDVAAGFRYYF